MADEKAVIPNEFREAKPDKAPKVWQYVGPTPAPLISNLPIDLLQPRLGTIQGKYPANELPEKYIEYVMKTNTAAKAWWK